MDIILTEVELIYTILCGLRWLNQEKMKCVSYGCIKSIAIGVMENESVKFTKHLKSHLMAYIIH